MKNNTFVIVLLIGLAAGGLWYVKKTNPLSPAMEKSEITAEPSTAVPASGSADTMTDSDVKEVIVEGSEFKFLPATLTFKKGEPVKLILKNTGKMTHDFVIDELGVRTKIINGGEEDVIEFTPQQAGTFEYYCSVGKHRQMGMVGKVTVTE